MKNCIWKIFLFLFLTMPSVALAQNYKVALFAPSLDFKDGAERNDYVTKIAQALSRATNANWSGQAYARSADFEAARADTDVAIVDAEYYSSKLSSYPGAATLSSNSGVSRKMQLVSKKGSSDKLYNYRGKRLILVSNSSLSKKFVENTALGGESPLEQYFSSVEEARDIRAALNAVELGKAELTLAYDGYTSGFTTVYTSPSVSLPVIAITSTKLQGSILESTKAALRSLNIRAGGIISSSTSFSSSEIANLRNYANQNKAKIQYSLMDIPSSRVQVSGQTILPRTEGLYLNPTVVQSAPAISSLDKKLDAKL